MSVMMASLMKSRAKQFSEHCEQKTSKYRGVNKRFNLCYGLITKEIDYNQFLNLLKTPYFLEFRCFLIPSTVCQLILSKAAPGPLQQYIEGQSVCKNFLQFVIELDIFFFYQSQTQYLRDSLIEDKSISFGQSVEEQWKYIILSHEMEAKKANNKYRLFMRLELYLNIYQLIIAIIKQAMVKSQLQNTILRFSREVWKFVYKLNEPARSQLTQYVRAQFEEHKKIPRLKFHQIEYRLRQGRNRFAMVKECGSIDAIKFRTN